MDVFFYVLALIVIIGLGMVARDLWHERHNIRRALRRPRRQDRLEQLEREVAELRRWNDDPWSDARLRDKFNSECG